MQEREREKIRLPGDEPSSSIPASRPATLWAQEQREKATTFCLRFLFLVILHFSEPRRAFVSPASACWSSILRFPPRLILGCVNNRGIYTRIGVYRNTNDVGDGFQLEPGREKCTRFKAGAVGRSVGRVRCVLRARARVPNGGNIASSTHNVSFGCARDESGSRSNGLSRGKSALEERKLRNEKKKVL